jgi:hypothetical protein
VENLLLDAVHDVVDMDNLDHIRVSPTDNRALEASTDAGPAVLLTQLARRCCS